MAQPKNKSYAEYVLEASERQEAKTGQPMKLPYGTKLGRTATGRATLSINGIGSGGGFTKSRKTADTKPVQPIEQEPETPVRKRRRVNVHKVPVLKLGRRYRTLPPEPQQLKSAWDWNNQRARGKTADYSEDYATS